MKDFSLFHDSFVVTKTSTYHLTIMLNDNGYSYCIIDSVRKNCVGIKNVNFNNIVSKEDYYKSIEKHIEGDVFLSKSYKNIDFIYTSERSTLVPEKLFDKKRLKEHFCFLEQLNDYEELHFNKLKRINAVNIFSIPSYITTLMVNKFPELKFYHQATNFIDNSLLKSLEVGPMIGIMLSKNFFDLSYCQSGKLILYNNFEIKTESDFVYHVVNVMQQLQVKNNIPVYLAGNFEKKSNIYQLISKYVKNLKVVKITDNSECKYSFKEIPEHFLTNLLNIQ